MAKKSIIYTLITGVTAAILWFILTNIGIELNITFFAAIAIIFLLMGIGELFYIFSTKPTDKPAGITNKYMLVKVAKIGIGAVLLLIIYKIADQNIEWYILTFGVFYILLLAFEVYWLKENERRISNSKRVNNSSNE